MFCSGCGQALEASQGFCPQCGRPFTPATSPVPGLEMEVERYAGKIRVLGILWLVYAGLALVVGMMGLAVAHALLLGGFGPFARGPMAHMWFLPGLMRLAIPLLVLRSVLAAVAGWGLMERTEWGRIVAIVAAVLCLFKFPLGTVIGIGTLVMLLGARNWTLYERL
jgi:hypothetical protein